MGEYKLDGKTPDIAEVNIEKLKTIFPDVFEEGKIDFEKLQQDLGNYIDEDNERYNFTWNGKGKALRLAQAPSTGTLRPCKEESKDWDTTQNLYIEGDNLEVLKLLQKSYHGKVKMIYIDPPYNTGNDFVYPDDYKDNIENYKEITGQVDSDGYNISSNSETNGRYHTDWLNMIYPRLRLARNLLKEDGVIFISIDEYEIKNLLKICDEVFGEVNCVGLLPRKTKSATNDPKNNFNNQHDYILIYGKTEFISLIGEKKDLSNYKNPDNDPRGAWVSGDPSAKSGGKGTYFEIINPYNNQIDLPPKGRYWAFSKETLDKYIKEGKVKFKREYKANERGFIFKRYVDELKSVFQPIDSLYFIRNDFMNQVATKSLNDLGISFDYSKPLNMIECLVKYSNADQNSLILDFFSGSATTAHAVMKLNAEDNGNRKFIMVQLPEPCDEKIEAYQAGFKNICDIGKERICRAGEKIKSEAGLTAQNLDIGFKVFKLNSSNIKKWQPEYDNLENSLIDYINNYVEDRTELDVVYEIILKCGLDLTYPIEEYTFEEQKVYSVGYGALLICLDDNITTAVAEGMVKLKNELKPETWKVVFKDNGFKNDSNKTNIKEILKCGGLDEDAFTTL